MANAVKRLNYYDHQFLRVPDFADEQNYHLNMRRLHNSALHTWGVVQGLQVTLASGGTGTAVSVNAGVAIDSTGREVVLPADTNLELGGEATGTTLFITIAYAEQQTDPTTEAGGPGNTRITEMPNLSFSKTAPADASMTLILARVPRTATGLGPIDASDRRQAGVVVGSDLTISTLTLKKDGVTQTNWPVLSCSAANQATLSNAGLTVSGTVGIGPTPPNRSLSISGAGGTGTYANVRNANHEVLLGVDTVAILSAVTASDLQIRTNNQTRVVVQAETGNVGIGTAAPISELHIREDAAGALGPNLTLMNGGGTAGSAAAIDLSGYDTGTQAPASRIQGIDDGSFSAHLTFSSKRPGANNNPLVETMRLTSAGNVGIGVAPAKARLEVGGMVGNTVAVFGSNQGVSMVAAWPNVGFNCYYNGGWKALAQGWAGIIGVNENSGSLDFYVNPAAANAADAALTPQVGVSIGNSGAVLLGNSDIYFTKTDHNHSGFGNTAGFAAIENAANFGGLMILGRTVSTSPLVRMVKMWDRFEMNGDAFKPGGGAWGTLSDKKLKKNISSLQGVLDKLLSLRGVSFEWKDPKQQGNLTGPQMGLVAQEVEKVFPEWVGHDLEGTKTLSIRGFEALVIEAFREIKQELDALNSAVMEIQAKLGTEVGEQRPTERAMKSSARNPANGKKKEPKQG